MEAHVPPDERVVSSPARLRSSPRPSLRSPRSRGRRAARRGAGYERTREKRALAKPESVPNQSGELAASATSSGRWRRRPLNTRIAASASGMPTWTCSAHSGVRRTRPAHRLAHEPVALGVDQRRVAEAAGRDARRRPSASRRRRARATRAAPPTALRASSAVSGRAASAARSRPRTPRARRRRSAPPSPRAPRPATGASRRVSGRPAAAPPRRRRVNGSRAAERVLHGRASPDAQRRVRGDPPEHERRGEPARVAAGRDAAGVGARRRRRRARPARGRRSRRPPSVVVIAGDDLDHDLARRAARPARRHALAPPRSCRATVRSRTRSPSALVGHRVPGARPRLARGPLHDVDLRPGARPDSSRRARW